MVQINHLNRFINCIGSEPIHPSHSSIVMLDEYLMATDGRIGYAQRVPCGSIPSGWIDKKHFTSKSEINITNKQVMVDGVNVEFDSVSPFTQKFIDNAINNINDVATITDINGLLKLIAKFSKYTSINPANNRKRTNTRGILLIDLSNGALLGYDEHDVNERIILGDCSAFIDFPRTVDNKHPISINFFAYQPVYFMRILKEMAKDCDCIKWRFNRNNSRDAYIFHDAADNITEFYLLMPMRQ